MELSEEKDLNFEEATTEFFHHDKATSAHTVCFLVLQPPYSLDMATDDFSYYPNFKEH